MLLHLCCSCLAAQINMPLLFHDGMVLQQKQDNKLWGTAKAGQQLTLTFAGHTQATTTDAEGRFEFFLSGLEPSNESQTLSITDGNQSFVIKDVLVGDVFLLSGQSNMAWKIKQLGEPYITNAKRDADYPDIRYYAVAKNLDTDFEGIYGNEEKQDKPWVKTTTESVLEYSAVGFYFGRKLHKDKQVPIGLIDCSQGSSYADAWISQEYIDRHAELKPYLVSVAQSGNQQYYRNPGVLHKNMLSRVLPYTVCGILWYQGEANAPYYQNYHKVLPAVIDCFRESYGNKDLPFVIIQLSAYENPNFWPYIREIQDSVAAATPHAAMVSTIDIGEANRIHPREKEPVGERCALAIRHLVYGEQLAYSGPSYRTLRIEGNKAIISFAQAEGLYAKDDIIAGFEICDRNYHYLPVTDAEINDNEITVWNSSLAMPEAVRYGWSNVPEINLYNNSELPANPFRTSKQPPVTSTSIYYVVPGGSGQKTGYDWENALDLNSKTLKLGKSGDQFWVKEGVYHTTIQYNDRSLYGGFNGTETRLEQRNWAKYPTILQGVENAISPLAVVQTSAILDGFVLQDNQLARTGAASKNGGGAQLGSNCIIRNCIIRNNSTSGLNLNTLGGGIYVFGKDEHGTYPIIENCLITHNAAPNNGGGIQIANGAALRLINTTITGNMISKPEEEEGSGFGCGVGLGNDAKLLAENVIVFQNSKSDGTIYSFGTNQGGNANTISTLRNCAYDVLHEGNEVHESILFKETTACIDDLSANKTPGFQRPAMFVGPVPIHSASYNALLQADYSLSPGSFCINTGRNSASLSSKDLAGNMRRYGNTIDIGAYEATQVNSSLKQPDTMRPNFYIWQDKLILTNLTEGVSVFLFDASGKIIYSSMASGNNQSFILPHRGLYIVKIGKDVVKVLY